MSPVHDNVSPYFTSDFPVNVSTIQFCVSFVLSAVPVEHFRRLAVCLLLPRLEPQHSELSASESMRAGPKQLTSQTKHAERQRTRKSDGNNTWKDLLKSRPPASVIRIVCGCFSSFISRAATQAFASPRFSCFPTVLDPGMVLGGVVFLSELVLTRKLEWECRACSTLTS